MSYYELFNRMFSIMCMGIFIEFYLHLLPFTSIAYDQRTRKDLSLKGLAGITLAAVQHFSNKYTVLYGIPSTWATFNGISCPGGPHNVASRCTFRDMWREFDKGLHLFLKDFIYLPITSFNPELVSLVFLGTFGSFFTVYYWHGASETCLYWASANCAGVIAEKYIKKVENINFGSEGKFISDILYIIYSIID